MRVRRLIIVLFAAGSCLLPARQAGAWRGGGGFGGGRFGGRGFGGGGFGGDRFGDFHPSGFGGGFGSVHQSGFGGGGFGDRFGGGGGLGGDRFGGGGFGDRFGGGAPESAGFGRGDAGSGAGALPGAGFGRAGVGGQAGLGGGLAGSAGVGRGPAGSEYNRAADHYSDYHNNYYAGHYNYGSIQHYDASSNLNVYHGPAGGTAATYQGAYVSGAAAKGPAGYGAAAVKGPAGGTAAGYRGPYSAGAVAHLPSGYTAATWHGTTYYHSGYSFYQPTWYAGTVSYVPVYPPTGFFFASLPPTATPTVVNNNTYYVSDGVYYQPTTQNGQQGYGVVAAPAQSETPQQAAPAAGGGPDPFVLLKKMSECMSREKHIRMAVSETFDQVAANGQKIQIFTERSIRMKRPDRIAVEVSSAGVQRRITCDGEIFTVVDLLKNVYATMPMKGSLDSVMDTLARQYGMAQPVEDLLYGDINARLAPKIQAGQFLGQEKVAGHTCNHVAYKQADLSWQVWMDDGDKPVPRRLVISYDTTPGRPKYTLLITKFETPVLIPDEDFKAKLPDGAVSASMTSLTGQATGSQ